MQAMDAPVSFFFLSSDQRFVSGFI